MLIDVHNHIIPGVDDGAKDITVSLDMCKIAHEDGINGIIATPHYIHGAVNNSREVVESNIVKLNKNLAELQIDLELYPGCEAFICLELPNLVRGGHICTLCGSRYILTELPLNSIPSYTAEVIYKLKLDGFTPIIAHPERNMEISDDPDILYDLIMRGALAQVNAPSLNGIFGKRIMDTAFRLLKLNMVHLLASDAHTAGGRSPRLSIAMDNIEKLSGPEILLKIVRNNEAILNNQMISIEEPIKYGDRGRKHFFNSFKKAFTGQ